MIINGKNAVLGRLASSVARELLKGEEVTVTNAGKIIITGDEKKIVAKYTNLRQIGSPQHGPFFPTRPEMIVKRAIRGMLPYKTPKGRKALKMLRVYANNEDKNAKSIATKEIRTDYITIAELSKHLGWRE
ncbi:MAG: 50S ribosomal protein L13 [Candidatus Aenigmarchaeota archaeon]|nr:50S ribosomal protein L13 [Candidatus Aenigmarchaeota archaeon]